jgi:branched-chain amino acid transport system substrate-binding protein
MNEVREQYASDIPSSSFAQMGYLAARAATEGLLAVEGDDYSVESVNEAFRSITNFASDLWCRPWYFESGVGGNVSNNVDYTVVPAGDKMELLEDCFEIAELDADANLLAEIRAAEEEQGLNTGG